MTDDWPGRLRHFSRVVDVIEQDTFDDIKSALARYFDEVLECHYFRVLIDGVSHETDEGELIPALDCLWTNDNTKVGSVVPIRGSNRNTRQIVLGYVAWKPMWVVARDGGPLADTSETPGEAVDLWSAVQPLPAYRGVGNEVSRTSIIVPLEYGERRFGVMNLEFEDHLPISKKATRSVRVLADALGRIIWIWKTTLTQFQGTHDAFDELERTNEFVSSPLHRHTVFVASSGRADPGVMDIILAVLATFEELFDVIDWRAEVASGNINEQVRTAIAASEFGVCYISEPAQEHAVGGPAFFDNPNVLFEAGMLQMVHELRDQRDAAVSRWIPIREGSELSPPLPFDFAGDRVIGVPRVEETGALDAAAFEQRFRAAVTELVDQLGID